MWYLFDTHLLIWAKMEPSRLPLAAREVLEELGHDVLFSAASILEISIKFGLRRPDFTIEPALFRHELLESGYVELPVTGRHAAWVGQLPALHKDPVDRLLVAQATVEGIWLLTVDSKVAGYPGPVRQV